MAKKKSTKIGRPTVMTPEVLEKLNTAYSNGAGDKLAARIAGVSYDALNDYCNKNPKFYAYKEKLKATPSLKALNNINKALVDGDIETSKWYLERAEKDAFGKQTQITGKDGDPLIPRKLPHDQMLNVAKAALLTLEDFEEDEFTGKVED